MQSATMTRLTNSIPLLYFAMLGPGYLVFWGLVDDYWYYAQMMYQSGVYSIRMLIITIAVTPVLAIINWVGHGKALGRWLLQRRKHFGLASFIYAAVHLLHYVMHAEYWDEIVIEFFEIDFFTGWLAFLIFVALAVTSNRWSTRKMGRGWKKLHLWIYPASAFAFLHWYLFDEFTARVMFWVGIFLAVKLVHFVVKNQRMVRVAVKPQAGTVREA